MAMQTERAVLAGGCFWGMQDLIRKMPGVIKTRVGYAGGEVPNATYHNHGTHAEAIEITFDPKITSYRALLELFFQIHDPTTRNRQGNDVGSSYRSAIFYVSDEQKRIAEDTIADVNAAGLWPGKVVTEVAPRRSLLGSRAGPSGLPRTFPRRLHLPLRSATLEAAAPDRGEGQLGGFGKRRLCAAGIPLVPFMCLSYSRIYPFTALIGCDTEPARTILK
jgi:peptide-methionine (S)-S-oxide reductase